MDTTATGVYPQDMLITEVLTDRPIDHLHVVFEERKDGSRGRGTDDDTFIAIVMKGQHLMQIFAPSQHVRMSS